MPLSKQQIAFFSTFGFLKFPSQFVSEMDRITDTFERIWANHGGGHFGKPHDGKQRSALVPFIDQDEYLSCLIDDPRIDEVVSSLLGDNYNYTGSDGNYYVGDTGWHSDGYLNYPKYTSVKMAFYLDPVTKNTGCLRVIPGSHHLSDKFAETLQETLPNSKENKAEDTWGTVGSEVPAVALECEPGDLLMFNHRTKHSSWGGNDRRRMFTINFSERYDEEDIDELRKDINTRARFWQKDVYGERMLRTADPKRMVHLEQRLANADQLPALAEKARREMNEPARG